MLFPLTRNFTPDCLSPPRCTKKVTGDILLGVTLWWTSIPSRGGGGVTILSVASCYRNWIEVQPCGCPVVCVFTIMVHYHKILCLRTILWLYFTSTKYSLFNVLVRSKFVDFRTESPISVWLGKIKSINVNAMRDNLQEHSDVFYTLK